jgi:hypothetical protein
MHQDHHLYVKPQLQRDIMIDVAFYMFISYGLFYIIGISIYAISEFIIVWKENMWEKEPDSKVMEELKYLIYKHSEFTDLDTNEKIINISRELSQYNQQYRIDLYKSGLKIRVQRVTST